MASMFWSFLCGLVAIVSASSFAQRGAIRQRRPTGKTPAIRREIDVIVTALEATGTGVLITDARLPNHPVLYANQAFTTITGYNAADLLGVGALGLLSCPESDPAIEQAINAALAAGQPYHNLVPACRADGSMFWNELSIVPVPDSRGRPRFIVAVQRDVSARVNAEAAIHRRDLILEAVRQAAATFLSISGWQITAPFVVARLATAADATRAYLYQTSPSPDDDTIQQLHYSWYAQGVSEPSEPPSKVSLRDKGLGRWAEHFMVGSTIAEPLNSLPPAERDSLTASNVRALVGVPVMVRGRWWGTLFFDDERNGRVWSSAEVDALRAAADLLGSTIEREQTELNLRQRELELGTVLDTAPIFLLACDQQGIITLAEGAALHTLGHKPGQAVGRSIFENYRHQPRMVECVRRALTGETITTTVDFGLALFEAHYSPLFDSTGGVTGMISALFDVTARQRAEEALRASEERFHLLSERIPDVIFRYRIASPRPLEYLSPAFLRITGYTLEDLYTLGERVWEVIHPNDQPDMPLFRQADIVARSLRVICRNGAIRRFEINSQRIFDISGELIAIEGVARDITERYEAEEAYRALVNHTPQGLVIIQDGRIVFANNALARITGYSVAELCRMTMSDVAALLHPDDRQQVMNLLKVRMEGIVNPDPIRFRFFASNGATRWLESQGALIEYRGRQAFQIAFVDISEQFLAESARREAEETRLRSEALLAEMGRLAHVGWWLLDVDTMRGRASEEASRIFGLEPMPGHAGLEIGLSSYIPEARALIDQAIRGAISDGTPFDLELPVTQVAGETRWTRIIGRPEYEQGQIVRLIGSIQDITERKSYEDALIMLNLELEERVAERTADLVRANRTLAEEVMERQRIEIDQERLIQGLHAVLEIAEELLQVHTVDELLRHAITRIKAALNLDRCGIFLDDGDYYRGTYGFHTPGDLVDESELRISKADFWSGRTIIPQPPQARWILADGVQRGWNPIKKQIVEIGHGWAIISAIRSAHGEVGIFINDNRISGRPPNAHTQEILSVFCSLLGSIIERRRAEHALSHAYNQLSDLNSDLAQSRDLLRAIFDGLHDGLVLLNQNRVVLTANQAFNQICRGKMTAPIGRPWQTNCLLAESLVDAAFAQGQRLQGRERIVHEDSRFTMLDIQVLPLHAATGVVDRVVIHVVDVTDRLLLETRALENERFAASGRLAATVAHEINTPLQSVQALLFLLENSSGTDREEYLKLATQEIERIAGIVRNLQDLYRPSNAEPGVVDLNRLIERVLILADHLMSRQKVMVMRDLAPSPVPIWGRADQLTQVLINLIVNAVQAMPDGGQITLRSILTPTSDNGTLVRLTVADSGVGMTAEQQERIFEPFFTTKESGTGLGLAISAQILSDHSGEIAVRSAPGQGSAFTISLPVKA